MPHKCVKCGNLYGDGSEEILKGCSNCSSRFFFFVRQEHLDALEKESAKLSQIEKKDIEKDILDLIPDVDKDMPVIFNLESIRIKKPGKFEIDLVQLFKGNPLIYKIEEGKYIIDLPSTFMLRKHSDREKKK